MFNWGALAMAGAVSVAGINAVESFLKSDWNSLFSLSYLTQIEQFFSQLDPSSLVPTALGSTQVKLQDGIGHQVVINGTGLGPVTITSISQLESISSLQDALKLVNGSGGTLSSVILDLNGVQIAGLTITPTSWVFTSGSEKLTISGNLPTTIGAAVTALQELVTPSGQLNTNFDSATSILAGYGITSIVASANGVTQAALTWTGSSLVMTAGDYRLNITGALPRTFADIVEIGVKQDTGGGSTGFNLNLATITQISTGQTIGSINFGGADFGSANILQNVKATDIDVDLTVAQAEAIEAAGAKVDAAAGDTIVIADTAAHVEALTTGEIAGLPAIGVTQITTTNAGAILSVAQALALETGGIALSVPTGGVAEIFDEAATLGTLTVQEIAGLTKLHVTQILEFGAVTLDMAQALALETAGVTLPALGGSVDVVATAAAIEGLAPSQIAGLGSLHVSAVEASDASLVLTAAQTLAFENAHITLSAPSGDSVSVSDPATDILWQNTSTGQASLWVMSGNTLTGGGPVTPNPGPSFRAVGTGDFNKDGKSDILWQNMSTGQASIWEMSGSTLIGGGPVTPNPGPTFRAVATGDFNGDGFSDILWQNTVTGQASIWEMNGTTLEGAAP
jgi:FG-GAP-like repeat